MKYLFLLFFPLIGFSQDSTSNVIDESETTIFVSRQYPTPQYPGGEQKMLEFLYSSFILPEIDTTMIINRLAVVSFVIDEDGCVGEILLRRSFGIEALDNEFIRVVGTMPKWEPAIQNGKAIKITWNLPFKIDLKLNENKND